MLFVGPPGLGKTTLAQIVARELGVNFRATSGPVIAKAGDLAALLTNLEERDVLFIDEIHRLNPAVEEILYPAMEDFQLDLIIGSGPAARSVKIDLAQIHAGRRDHARRASDQSAARPLRHSGAAQFLLGGRARADRQSRRARARHRHHAPTAPTRSRGARAARRASPDGCCAACATSPPLPARLRSIVRLADKALAALEVDAAGLDAMDRRYLTTIAMNYGGGPVGVETLAAALSEPRDAIEDIIEPYLIQCGLVAAHAARPADHQPRLPPSRLGRARARPGPVRLVWCGRGGVMLLLSKYAPHLF